MDNADLRRRYFIAGVDGSASAGRVASVLRRAADTLDGLGDADVHHLAFDVDDRRHASSVSLTVYFDHEATAR